MDRRCTEQTRKLLSAVIAAMALMAAICGGFLAASGS
jgi:hypothetical protein